MTTSKNQIFQYEVSNEPDGSIKIKLQGYLNENANLPEITEVLSKVKGKTKNVSFDLQHVTKMNSCGIRDWVLFMQDVKKLVSYRFSVISSIFFEQACVVPRLLGDPPAPVQAFEAPYFCAKCDREISIVLQKSQVLKNDGTMEIPRLKCGKCNSECAFDDVEEEFLNFFKIYKNKK